MGSAIVEVVPAAIGLALVNPVPIIAVILLLFTPRAKLTATAFMAGWMLGLLVVASIMLFGVSLEEMNGDQREPSTAASIGRFLIGLLLLMLAVRQWRGRPQPQDEPKLPTWMETLQNASPLTALGIGALLSSLNPKNLAFTVAAVINVAQAELGIQQQFVPVGVYILVGSVGVVAPVVWFVVAQERAALTLAECRVWLAHNYATLMTIVLSIFGVILASQGLARLVS